MEIRINGLDVTVGNDAVSELVRERLLRNGSNTKGWAFPVPRIGSPWHSGSGIFAGIARGLDGRDDYPLIVGDYMPGSPKWQEGLDLAAKMGNGWRVPTRPESALCFAHVPELFEKVWHWTSQPYAGIDGYAWAQYFDNGSQDGFRKGDDFRVRVVRSGSFE